MKTKLDNFKSSKRGAEIIEIIFGVVIAGVVCVVAYKGIKGIVDGTIKQAGNAFGSGSTGAAPNVTNKVPDYGTALPEAA